MSENPKCPYCGGEMEVRWRHRPDGMLWKGVVDPREIPYDAVVTYVDDNFHYYCRNCKTNTPYRNTPEEAYDAAMKRENKCKTYAEDFKEHFGHSWNNKNNNWRCRGRLYNDSTDCVNSPRYDCEACWNEEMEDEE